MCARSFIGRRSFGLVTHRFRRQDAAEAIVRNRFFNGFCMDPCREHRNDHGDMLLDLIVLDSIHIFLCKLQLLLEGLAFTGEWIVISVATIIFRRIK
jgi:hypothetical protein